MMTELKMMKKLIERLNEKSKLRLEIAELGDGKRNLASNFEHRRT
jgi:hypothetical protein